VPVVVGVPIQVPAGEWVEVWPEQWAGPEVSTRERAWGPSSWEVDLQVWCLGVGAGLACRLVALPQVSVRSSPSLHQVRDPSLCGSGGSAPPK
jgi:hypothetical protein